MSDAVGSGGRDARGVSVQLPRSPGANVIAVSKEGADALERVVPPRSGGAVAGGAVARVLEREDRVEWSLGGELKEGASSASRQAICDERC